MQNFFTFPECFIDGMVRLTGEEYHHAARVCRVRVGEMIGVADGRGRRVEARIETITGSYLEARATRDVSGRGEPSREITLALSLIKPARFEIAVEKCTEFGVRRFIPLAVQRCEYSPARFNSVRLARIALEAAKQSGRSWLPDIAPVSGIEVLSRPGHALLVASQKAQESLEDVLSHVTADKLILAVGPEGDFTPEEIASLGAQGALFFSLGGLTLRAETAAIAAVALCGVNKKNV
ncbi:MAG: RsmE family RNA methyltransferase [Candidatus Latescibacter sp.]|nr:RsmE family RNA methyltransferase [Candidatus Latescibacter sp.]